MERKSRKGRGEIRPATDSDPAVIDTEYGPILIYRLPRGKVGIRHPPGMRVLKTVDKRPPIRKNPP